MSASEILNCRVQLLREQENVFSVEILGSISAPAGCQSVVAEVSIIDITDGVNKTKSVYTFIENDQIEYSQAFSHTVNLGRLPSQVTVIPDWMSIAKIPAHFLALPYAGRRNLQFTVSILSQQSDAELAYTICSLIYENLSVGYIELEERIRLAKAKAISLAFTVAATDKKISPHTVEIIRKWAKNNITISDAFIVSGKLFAQIIAVFPDGARICCNVLCRKITNAAPLKIRCDILELCMRVAGTGSVIAFEQLLLLKNIADRFEIPREKFRTMLENILPVRMYEIKDLEISLGITSDMDNNQLCCQLSKEYRKWNARVISRNPEIENQAENMLKLIAELRNECAK